MKQVSTLSEISINESIGITIGNFDGVHSGHQQVLQAIAKDCHDKGLKLAVITFNPHPLLVLKSAQGYLINSYAEREELLGKLDIDYLYEIPFTRDFSTLSPEDFLDKYILNFKNVKKLYLGHDFSFGANKAGNFEFVKKYCEDKDIEVEIQQKYFAGDESVCSSAIREALRKSDIELVNKMLGRNFFLKGRIIKGEGRGKKIGFPTANLALEKERIIPEKGVYFTQTNVDNLTFYSLTNIGNNPTFNDTNNIFVETHILDFDRDIYGEEIAVNFIKKIRDEKKFGSVNELINQISSDVEKVRELF